MIFSAVQIAQPRTIRNIAVMTLLVLAALAGIPAGAVSFLPLIHNYSKADYGAGLQNWDLAQGSGGEIYVGNSQGVLCYDGYSWTLTPLPAGAVARSLLMVGERLYVGSYMDFGYMERDMYGQLRYTSLWPRGYAGHDDEIWNIVKDSDGTVYFQSFSGYFSFDGKKVAAHYDSAMRPLYFHEVRGHVYVQVQEGDYYQLTRGKLVKVIGREQVGSDHIVAAVPGRAGHIILCSQWHGLFDYDGRRCVPLRTAVDGALCSTNINRAAFVARDSTLVVGTILGGIYGIALDGSLKWHYHTGNHLNNNSVLRLMADAGGNVWAALDIGVAFISTASPYSLLTPDSGQSSIGMVYDVLQVPPYLYIATNQAVWRYNLEGEGEHRFEKVTGSDGQNWYATCADGQLLIGHNDGIRHVTGTNSVPLGKHSSSTCLRMARLNGQDVMIESTYYVMRVYVKRGGQWVYSHDVQGFHAPVSQFEVDPQGNLWLAHMSRGLFKVTLSSDLKTADVKRYDVLEGDTVRGMVHVMKVCGRVLFTLGHRFYTYNDMTDSIEAFDDMGDLGREVCAATMVDDRTFWLASSDGFMLMRRDSSGYRPVNSVSSRFFGLDCNDNKNNVYVCDGIAYFNLNNGVGRLDMRHLDNVAAARQKLSIRSVTTTGRKGVGRPMLVNTSQKNRAKSLSAITVTLSFPNFDFGRYVFDFHLKGGGTDLTTESDHPQVTYSALAYGDFCLTCQVKTMDGQVVDTVDYYFCHPRPFYASWWAWLVYLLLLGGLAYLLVRYRTRKTEEKLRHQFEDMRLQQDFKVLEQEKIIAEQRHQLLEAQLNDKAREAASLALDAAARNQAIESIRETLREKRREGAVSQRDMSAMLSQLGESADSDNFWEVYQNNFNLIHKNFFKNLKAQYPALTPTDLRFCALLRLNLSTKDIAQFTGLSVRGVEGARYRLRKKLNLPEGAHLVDFLINYE